MNKKFLIPLLLIACGICFRTASASLGFTVPFGGKILSSVAGDSCSAGAGPFTQSGTNASSNPFFYPTGKTPAPGIGSWVLGLYSTIVDTSDCKDSNNNGVSVNKVTLYGVGGGSGVGAASSAAASLVNTVAPTVTGTTAGTTTTTTTGGDTAGTTSDGSDTTGTTNYGDLGGEAD